MNPPTVVLLQTYKSFTKPMSQIYSIFGSNWQLRLSWYTKTKMEEWHSSTATISSTLTILKYHGSGIKLIYTNKFDPNLCKWFHLLFLSCIYKVDILWVWISDSPEWNKQWYLYDYLFQLERSKYGLFPKYMSHLLVSKRSEGSRWGNTPLSVARYRDITNKVIIYSSSNAESSGMSNESCTQYVMEAALEVCAI